jgi:hypothetical protein
MPVIPAFTLPVDDSDEAKSDLTSSFLAHAAFTIPAKATVDLYGLRFAQLDTRSGVNTRQNGQQNQIGYIGYGGNGKVEVTTMDDTPMHVLFEAPSQDLRGSILLTTCGKGIQEAFLDFQSTGAMHFLLERGESRVVELVDITGGKLDLADGKGSINFLFANHGDLYVDSTAAGRGNGDLLSGGDGPCDGGGAGIGDEKVKADIKKAKLVDLSFVPVDLGVEEFVDAHFKWQIAFDGGSVSLDTAVYIGITPRIAIYYICDVWVHDGGCVSGHNETRVVDRVDFRPKDKPCDGTDFDMLRSGDKKSMCWGFLTFEIPPDGTVEGTRQFAIQALIDAFETRQEVEESPPPV